MCFFWRCVCFECMMLLVAFVPFCNLCLIVFARCLVCCCAVWISSYVLAFVCFCSVGFVFVFVRVLVVV